MKNNSVKDKEVKKEVKKTILLLSLIIVVGFLTRSYFWVYGFSGFDVKEPGGMYAQEGFLNSASDIVTTFASKNPTLINKDEIVARYLYPLYLTPIYIFRLNESTYIFWLHHFFVAFTIIFIFLSASQLEGANVGLLGAFVYACHLHVAYWFNWLNFLEPFHFQLSMFMYFSLLCWKRASGKHLFLMAISGVMLIFTRPEGMPIAAVALLVLVYRLMVPHFGATRVIAVFLGSTLIFMLSGVYVLTQNKVVREVVFSSVHARNALYYSSQETPTQAKLVDEKIHEMNVVCGAKAAADPEKRNSYYWCSVEGLKRIKNDPLNYIYVFVKRIPHVIYPSFFREGVSWRYKLIDRSIMFFITLGVIYALIFRKKEKLGLMGLTLMGLTIYLIVIFIQSEWDVRVQLSAHVLLIPVASLGWIMFQTEFMKNFDQSGNVLPETKN
jgi:hypothetical protein